MNNENILLSICIPTFNRMDRLHETLSSVVKQISECKIKKVEIIIGDNCSSDGTEKIGKRYANNFPFIKYLRHNSNLGTEKNSFVIVEHATGDFLWFLSDDDYVLDGALSKIIEVILCQQNISYIFVNYLLWSDSLGADSGSSRCTIAKDCRIVNTDEFYLKVRFANSFSGSCVYTRTAWFNANPNQYSNNCWAHLYICNDIVQKDGCFIIAKPVLKMRCLSVLDSRMERIRHGNDHYHMDAHIMFIKFVDEISKQLTNPAAKKIGYELLMQGNFFQIVIYKYVAVKYDIKYLTSVFRDMVAISCFRKNVLFWLREVSILFSPKIVAIGIYNWWQLKEKICVWQDTDTIYQKFIFNSYNTIRLSKRWLVRNFR